METLWFVSARSLPGVKETAPEEYDALTLEPSRRRIVELELIPEPASDTDAEMEGRALVTKDPLVGETEVMLGGAVSRIMLEETEGVQFIPSSVHL
jgi:hypothetical protein